MELPHPTGLKERADDVGIVVIGRNEGERLIACLKSIKTEANNVVYVDSGSTDDSTAAAQRFGASVVNLDLTRPFTAARARNEGFAALIRLKPSVRFVQFIDGDCELVSSWLDTALNFIAQREDVAVVCGRRRERYPERSVYNRICDAEWDSPVGEAEECGGDALMRTVAFTTAGGFRAELVAGEEPELCRRMRQAGWKIWRIDAEMTRHDAAIIHFRQYWRRAVRSGQSDAEIFWRYSQPGIWVREKRDVLRASFWSGLLPIAIGIGTYFHPAALAGVLLYPLQVSQIAVRGELKSRYAWQYALLNTLAKFALFEGNLKYYWRFLRGRSLGLIEYKQLR
jgi:glycosyltransferase involved in cell wall biosynthesis